MKICIWLVLFSTLGDGNFKKPNPGEDPLAIQGGPNYEYFYAGRLAVISGYHNVPDYATLLPSGSDVMHFAKISIKNKTTGSHVYLGYHPIYASGPGSGSWSAFIPWDDLHPQLQGGHYLGYTCSLETRILYPDGSTSIHFATLGWYKPRVYVDFEVEDNGECGRPTCDPLDTKAGIYMSESFYNWLDQHGYLTGASKRDIFYGELFYKALDKFETSFGSGDLSVSWYLQSNEARFEHFFDQNELEVAQITHVEPDPLLLFGYMLEDIENNRPVPTEGFEAQIIKIANGEY